MRIIMITRPYDETFNWAHDAVIEAEVGERRVGSGAGFGERDLEFRLEITDDEIFALEKKLTKAIKVPVNIRAY